MHAGLDDSSQVWAQTAAEVVVSGANPLVWMAKATLIWLMESELRYLLLLFKAGRHNVSSDIQTE